MARRIRARNAKCKIFMHVAESHGLPLLPLDAERFRAFPEAINSQPPVPRHIRATVGGVIIHAVELGDTRDEGAPVFVLIHGLGMSSRYMMATARLLAITGKVYVPDLPGFGKSGKPCRALTISELSDSLAGWMATVNVISPILIGNSLGAQVIVDFAARHPTRLSAAVLVGLTIDPEARQVSAQVWRLLADIPREPPSLYWTAVTDYFRAGFGRCLETLRHALEDSVEAKLPSIQVPVLVVRGEHDPIVPQRWMELGAGLIPRARWVTMPAVAHAVNFSAPGELVEEVLVFRQETSMS